MTASGGCSCKFDRRWSAGVGVSLLSELVWCGEQNVLGCKGWGYGDGGQLSGMDLSVRSCFQIVGYWKIKLRSLGSLPPPRSLLGVTVLRNIRHIVHIDCSQ